MEERRTAQEVHPRAPGAMPPRLCVSHTAPCTGPCDTTVTSGYNPPPSNTIPDYAWCEMHTTEK